MLQQGYRHLPGAAQIIPVFSKSNFRLLLCHVPEGRFCLLLVIPVNTVLNIPPDQRFFVQKGRKHSWKLLLVLILLQNYPKTLFTDQSVLFLDYFFGL